MPAIDDIKATRDESITAMNDCAKTFSEFMDKTEYTRALVVCGEYLATFETSVAIYNRAIAALETQPPADVLAVFHKERDEFMRGDDRLVDISNQMDANLRLYICYARGFAIYWVISRIEHHLRLESSGE